MLKELGGEESQIDLLRAALLIALLDDPKLNITDYIAELDRMATELKENLDIAVTSGGDQTAALSERQKLELLRLYLFEQNGFHGSRFGYDKSNSYLNVVLDDREGLPISLSVVFMELGRRIGLKIEGIPLPGRFVVRHQLVRCPLEVDVSFTQVDQLRRCLWHVCTSDDCKYAIDRFSSGSVDRLSILKSC